MNYVIVAHYDEYGVISSDLSNFVNFLQNNNFSVILVSTHLNNNEMYKINKNIKTIVRDNYGYDFYSYCTGIQLISNNWENIDNIILMNSSFKIFDYNKLYSFFLQSIGKKYNQYNLLSLTTSMEVKYHCQSFLLRFNKEVLSNSDFKKWWLTMEPINDRQQVIYKYELGLTDFILKQGFSSQGLFYVGFARKIKSMLRYYRLQRKWLSWHQFNPCHFLWDDLYDDFGVAKYELINKNPYKFNINKIL